MSTTDHLETAENFEEFLKNVTVDNVIFGYHEKKLKVLLQRPGGFSKWTLTGGRVKKTESLGEAANRIAFGRTGLQSLFLQQFSVFGNPGRTQDKELTPERIREHTGIALPADHWLFDYAVSIGFYTLTEYSLVSVYKGPFDDEIEWWSIDNLPPLMFDHRAILTEALKSLQLHIYLYPVGYELLPEKFTLPEITSLYETILGKNLNSRNFARKIMSTGIVKKLDEKRSIGAHRSPFLYKFNKKKYDAALKNGLFFGF